MLTGLGVIDVLIEALATNVVGSPQAVGVLIFALLLIFGIMLRLPFILNLLLLLPVQIVLVAFGYTYNVVGAIHIFLILMVLGFNFLRQKQ